MSSVLARRRALALGEVARRGRVASPRCPRRSRGAGRGAVRARPRRSRPPARGAGCARPRRSRLRPRPTWCARQRPASRAQTLPTSRFAIGRSLELIRPRGSSTVSAQMDAPVAPVAEVLLERLESRVAAGRAARRAPRRAGARGRWDARGRVGGDDGRAGALRADAVLRSGGGLVRRRDQRRGADRRGRARGRGDLLRAARVALVRQPGARAHRPAGDRRELDPQLYREGWTKPATSGCSPARSRCTASRPASRAQGRSTCRGWRRSASCGTRCWRRAGCRGRAGRRSRSTGAATSTAGSPRRPRGGGGRGGGDARARAADPPAGGPAQERVAHRRPADRAPPAHAQPGARDRLSRPRAELRAARGRTSRAGRARAAGRPTCSASAPGPGRRWSASSSAAARCCRWPPRTPSASSRPRCASTRSPSDQAAGTRPSPRAHSIVRRKVSATGV